MKDEFKSHTSPSNIALIKYMGKVSNQNTPLNPSLSYTLGHLFSGVQLIPHSKEDWESLKGPPWIPLCMNENEKKRFLNFFKNLKLFLKLKNNYLIRSANNFPKNIGIASSASSFSALTKAAYQQALKEKTIDSLSLEEQAQLSRKGSGSSCRSFFSPWCLWNENNKVQKMVFPIQELQHDLILIPKEEKKVSSSQAHKRIRTSPLFEKRRIRALARLDSLLESFRSQNWKESYRIVKEEFEDMHSLFETSKPSFSYRTPETQEALLWLDRFWKKNQDGPLVTMDAGSVIHLLYRKDQEPLRKRIRQNIPFKIF